MNFLCKTESAADIPFVKTKVNYSEQTMAMGQYFKQNKLKLSKARLESRVQELIDNCVAAGAKNIVVRHVYAEDGICLFVYDEDSNRGCSWWSLLYYIIIKSLKLASNTEAEVDMPY